MVSRLALIVLVGSVFSASLLTAAASSSRGQRLEGLEAGVGGLAQASQQFAARAKQLRATTGSSAPSSSSTSASSQHVSVQDLLHTEDAQSALADLTQRQKQTVQSTPQPSVHLSLPAGFSVGGLEERTDSLSAAAQPFMQAAHGPNVCDRATAFLKRHEDFIKGGATVGALALIGYALLSKK